MQLCSRKLDGVLAACCVAECLVPASTACISALMAGQLHVAVASGARASRAEDRKGPHPPCVQVEGLPLLVCIEELFKVPVSVEDTPPEQWVCWPSCQLLYSGYQILGEP